MAKSKEELQKQLSTFKDSLVGYEKQLKKAQEKGSHRDIVNIAMSVAGLRNSIREIEQQLEKM